MKDKISMLSGAKEEGIKEGIEKGIKEGIYLVAKNLLSLGSTVDVVSKATGLNPKEVEELEKEIKHN